MSVLSIVAAVLAFVCAAVWGTVGVLGVTGKLPGNQWFGVRSPETGKTEAAFVLANRVAGPGFIGAAVILVMGGVLTLGVDGGWSILFALAALAVAVVTVGVVSGLGIRAAQALPDESGGCDCCSGGDDHGAASACSDDKAGSPADDCGQSSCGSCALQGMCETDSAAAQRR